MDIIDMLLQINAAFKDGSILQSDRRAILNEKLARQIVNALVEEGTLKVVVQDEVDSSIYKDLEKKFPGIWDYNADEPYAGPASVDADSSEAQA